MDDLDFMDMDCDEIDRLFLPPGAYRIPLIAPVSDAVPPSSSNPFLGRVDSLCNLLKKAPFVYR